MSHLIAQPTTAVDSIPLTRRIIEIMNEKGKFFSIQAMATRIGIHRETYRNMLKGEREIYTFELEKIAQDLKITPERLTQEDIKQDADELDRLFADLSDNKRALAIAETILSRAIGDTEKCHAFTRVGRALFELKHYDLAHLHRERAYEYALKIQEKYGETERLHESLMFLMTSFTVRNDFTNANSIVDKVGKIFKDHPIRYGALCYTLAMIAYNTGNFEETRNRFIQALHQYKQTTNVKEIGRAEHCVAFIEYKMGNYLKSKLHFENAIETLGDFVESKLTAIKDFIKVLIKLEELERAKEMVDKALVQIKQFDLPVLQTKFLLFKAIVNDDPNVAKFVLLQESTLPEHKLFACNFLMKYYSKTDDALALMQYYKHMEVILNDSTLSGEEDL